MKNCFRAIILPLLIVVGFAGLTFGGCTSVDDSLGKGLLPDDQKMFYGVETVYGIKSYLVKPDSIVTSRLGRMLFGKMSSDRFGRTVCGSVMQFVPAEGNGSETNPYGNKPSIDSIDFIMQIDNIYGDPSVEQKFYIYRFEPDFKLNPDSLYYPSFDAERYIDRSKPLFSFTMKDEKKGGLYKKLAVEPDGEIFLRELVGLDTLIYQESDDVFREIFRGLYFAPSLDPDEAPENGAVYDISPLSYSIYSLTDISFLIVYVHSHSDTPPADPEEKKTHWCEDGYGYVQDTLWVSYSLDDSDDMPTRSTSIITISHDYVGSEIDESLLVNPYDFNVSQSVESEVMYVQGITGVSSYLYFSDDFVNQLEDLKWFRDEQGNKTEKGVLVVNKALLSIYLEDMDNVEVIDEAPSRLGMYYNYKGVNPEAIPDYLYLYEAAYSDFRSNYEGYINGPLGNYQMNISMFVKDLANNPDITPRGIWLAPAVAIQFQEGEVSLQNFSEPGSAGYKYRMQVQITYTVVKERL